MAFSRKHPDKAESLESQIARLRQQVDVLMTDRFTPAVTDFAARTQRKFGDATTAVRGPAQSVSRTVKQRPWAAILIAAMVGLVLSRVTR